ncbi:MAG TPA: CU044_2847 family protein [Thermoleophilaceae bacterium]|nr:CU044_2847 family protein [Thermoleophilaceae bacterium]
MLVDGELPAGPQDVGFGSMVDLEQIRRTIAEFVETLVEPLRAMASDEVELEFSLGLELATGRLIAFLAAGKAQSGMKVRVRWKRTG